LIPKPKINVTDIYPDQYANDIFMAIILRNLDLPETSSPYSTAAMSWFHRLSNLVHCFGWNTEESALTKDNWIYFIIEALKVNGIEVVPGIHNRHPSYARLFRIRFDKLNGLNNRIMTTSSVLPGCLGFVLPLTKIPDLVVSTIDHFLSLVKPESAAANPKALVPTQNLLRRIFTKLDEPLSVYVQVLVIIGCLLYHRDILPVALNGQRQKEWNDTVHSSAPPQKRKFLLGFLSVGLYHRYKDLQISREDEIEWKKWNDGLGMSRSFSTYFNRSGENQYSIIYQTTVFPHLTRLRYYQFTVVRFDAQSSGSTSAVTRYGSIFHEIRSIGSAQGCL
jgi:hypothetical protein